MVPRLQLPMEAKIEAAHFELHVEHTVSMKLQPHGIAEGGHGGQSRGETRGLILSEHATTA